METTGQMFLPVAKIQRLLGMSKSCRYELAAKLNDELEKMQKLSFWIKFHHNFSLRE